jgi:hemoglobin
MKSLPTRSLAAVVAALVFGALAPAQDPLPRKELDKRLEASLFEVSKLGTDLYNRQHNEEGCFRTYDGALRAAAPLLDHHADLQKRVTAALKQAAGEPPYTRSFTLRTALDDIRKTVGPKPMPAPVPLAKPLWDRLGGESGVRKLVREAGNAAGADPKVNVSRSGKFKVDPERMENLLVAYLSSKSGGPIKYTGRDLKTAHAGMKITEGEFNALLGHVIEAMKANKIGQKEIDEVVAIVTATKPDVVDATAAPPPGKMLWDRLGGTDIITKMVQDFVMKAAHDPKVNFTRDGKYNLDDKGIAKLEKLVLELISSVTGGPLKYTGRDMKTVHTGMKITEAEFNAMAADLVDVLKDNKVGQDEIDDLIRIIASTKKEIVDK